MTNRRCSIVEKLVHDVTGCSRYHSVVNQYHAWLFSIIDGVVSAIDELSANLFASDRLYFWSGNAQVLIIQRFWAA